MNRKDKKTFRYKSIVFTLCVGFPISTSFALDMIASDSNSYYQLDGGSDITMPPVTSQQDITVGANAVPNTGFDCSGFNPGVSILNTFNNMENSIEGLSQNVIGSATAAIGSLPMLFLEKADPEIYDMIQNTIVHGMDTFDVSMQSCEGSLSQISQGQNPYQSWFSVSDSEGWLKYANAAQQGQSVDINQAQSTINANRGQFGVAWVHANQNSGGENQIPIHVISDVVVAGYNVLVDASRPLDDTAPAPSNSNLYRYWQTPTAAGLWATMVLGDISISADSAENTQAGIGLSTLMQTCPLNATNTLTCIQTLNQAIAVLVSASTSPTATQLAAVSANGLFITPTVINAIQNMQPQVQAVAISKLANDVALQNTLDEALLLRRVLIAGSQTQPVQSLAPALHTVQNALAELNNDIQSLTFEYQVRGSVGTNTLETVLNMGQNQSAAAENSSTPTQLPAEQNGGVYTQSSN